MIDLRARLARARSERGATLIEVLVALSILSIAAVAILAGLQMTVFASDVHRKQSVGGAFVRNYVEAVQEYVADGHYVHCGDAGDYDAATVGFDEPDGFHAGYDEVTPIAGDGAPVSCGDDAGVQRVRFTVESADGRASEELVVILRDPCSVGGDPGC